MYFKYPHSKYNMYTVFTGYSSSKIKPSGFKIGEKCVWRKDNNYYTYQLCIGLETHSQKISQNPSQKE